LLGLSPLALGVIFLAAGISKLFAPYDFLSAVYAYGLTGPAIGFWVAWFLSWLEVTLGCSLLAGVLEKGSAIVSIVLSLMFVYVKLYAIHEDRLIGCGCVVTGSRGLIGIGDLIEAVVLLALSTIVFLSSRLRAALGHPGPNPS